MSESKIFGHIMRSDFDYDFVHVEKSKAREAKAEEEKPRLEKENLEYVPALFD